MELLILGGTVFLGRHLVTAALERGHRVTLFNRGQHNPELFPGVEKRHEVEGSDVAAILTTLDARIPGLRDRLVEGGPRLRPHINVFVAGVPADLTTPVAAGDIVHVIPAVSGG